MEGAGGQYPALKVFPALFMTMFCINYLIGKREKTAHILKKVFLLHRPLVIDMKMFYY